MDKCVEVFFRKKFDKYFTEEERWIIVEKIVENTIFFSLTATIADCCGPKDNKLLEAAVCAKAACIVTGDKDLLIFHSFREIPIINAIDFINRLAV